MANTITRPKIPTNRGGGRGNRANSNIKPPGEVNLERSYQICQAVIQNSPNRHQLRQQLRPPPSLLATKKDDQTQYSAVTSSNKMVIFEKKNINFIYFNSSISFLFFRRMDHVWVFQKQNLFSDNNHQY